MRTADKAPGKGAELAAGRSLATALHGACTALADVREAAGAPAWTEKAGAHVALALAAVPDEVLRSWLFDGRSVGGGELYAALRLAGRVGESTRTAGTTGGKGRAA